MTPLISTSPSVVVYNASESTEHFGLDLDSIVELVTSGTAGSSVRGAVYAVYGGWGAGKSSAIETLKTRLKEIEGLSTSDYDARAWESEGNARLTVAYELLAGIHQAAPDGICGWVSACGARLGVDSQPPSVSDAGAFRQYLFEVLTASNWPVMERQATSAATELLSDRQAHIVFVDDLDRCGTGFTCDLLAAANFWVSQPDLPVFFVVAVSKEHVLRALEEEPLGKKSPLESLEKYVHHSVTVPTFLTGSREVATFQVSLLKGHARAAHAPESTGLDRIRDLLSQSASGDERCSRLLWPVIEVGMEPVTPRRAVDRLNVLLRSYQHQGWASEEDQLVKEIIVSKYWPEFFGTIVRPLQLAGDTARTPDLSSRRVVLQKLVSLGRLVEGDGESGDAEAYKRVAESIVRQAGVRPAPPVDLRLLRYLAMEPAWTLDQFGPSQLIATGVDSSTPRLSLVPDILPGRGSSTAASRESSEYVGSVGEILRHPGDRPEAGPVREDSPVAPLPSEGPPDIPGASVGLGDHEGDLSTALEEAYWRLDYSFQQGDRDQTEDVLRTIFDLVGPIQTPEPALAPTIGNIALTVEKMGLVDLARFLHLAAHRADPSHINVTQNLIEFALDAKQPDLYPNCAQWLAEIDSSRHKPWRTALLRLRLSARFESFEVDTEAELRILLDRCADNKSVDDFVHVLVALREVPEASTHVTPSMLSNLARDVVEASETTVTSYQTVRILADHLAASDASEDEDVALDIYCWLLRTGLPTSDARSECLEVQLNALALIASRGRHNNAVAAELLRLHRENPEDIQIARRLARVLKRLGDDRNAVSLLQGRLVHEPSLEPPEKFHVPRVQDRWWADLDFGEERLAPCALGFPCGADDQDQG